MRIGPGRTIVAHGNAVDTNRQPGCLDEHDALDFIEGQLSPSRAVEVEQHADGCAPCRWRLAAIARSTTTHDLPGAPPGATSHVPASLHLLQPGQQLGRYTVDGLRGVGSMGVVYAAHDAALGRSVALKLLRFDAVAGALDIGRARLVREARALAALAHPNLVAIYDVGSYGEEVFAAMELVEGATLDDWLHAAPRTAAQIIDLMAGAGRGLAAAHAAGVIHRDVKPDNIVVGHDGRARIREFGAAAPPGTLAYMSPEQLTGRPVGPETDQWSFAVTLYEALHGERPFGGRARGDVPARIRRVLRRALEVDPRRRYPAMAAFVAELVGEPRRRRRRVMAVAGGVAIAATAALWLGTGGGGEPPCAGVARAPLWDPVQRVAVARTFLARRERFAADAFARVARGLDVYTGAWTAMHGEACTAIAARPAPPPEVIALRLQCLGRDLELTRQLIELFAAPGFDRLGQAVGAVDALPRLEACGDIAALRAVVPLPSDPGLRARLAALDVRTAELRARWLIDDYASVRQAIPALVTEASRIGYAPATATLLLLAGDVESTFGDPRAAEARLAQGLRAAEAAGNAEQVARAWISLMRVVGNDQHRFADGDRLRRNAEQAVDRALAISPSAGNRLRVSLLGDASALVFARGDSDAAIARASEALALEHEHFGSDTVIAARLHYSLAIFKLTAGDPAGAWAEIQHALAITQRRLGVGPRLVTFRTGAAAILQAQGKLDDAIAEYDHALAIAAQVFTTDTLEVAVIVNSLANVYQTRGDLDRAGALFERGLAILVKTRGEDSAEVSAALYMLGANAKQLGHWPAAQAYFERALAISETVEGPTHHHVAERLIGLGSVLVEQGRQDRAIPVLERAVAILDGRRARGEGEPPAVTAGARFALAQALWIRPGERPRAQALVRSARDLLAGASNRQAIAVTGAIARWSAAHPR